MKYVIILNRFKGMIEILKYRGFYHAFLVYKTGHLHLKKICTGHMILSDDIHFLVLKGIHIL